MRPIKFRLWLAGTIFTSYTLGMVGVAFAQTSAPSTTPAATQGLATITVVARKKKEDLQKVPLSVTAIPSKTLKQAHVENLHDVIALTPGVNISDIGAEAATSITIRGDTDQTFGLNVPDVALFLDGTYLRDPTAINVAAIPLQDVEVVKGPVSALYGRDAYAGVINFVAARPTTTPHAEISETAGDFGKSELQGDISGPIFGDKVLGELFGDFDTFNGTFKDKISGATGGSYQKKDFGGLLDFNWTDNFTTHFDFYYGYDYFGQPAVEALTPNCGLGTEIAPNGAPIFAENLYCGQVKSGNTVNIGNDPAAGNEGNARRTFYGSMRNTATYSWGTIDSITGASQVDEVDYQIFDGSSLGEPYQLANAATPFVANGNYANEHSFYGTENQTANVSEELRYNSPQDLPVRVGGGGFFYSEQRNEGTSAAVSEFGIPPGQVIDGANFYGNHFATPTGSIGPNQSRDKHTTDEEAAFASVEADILPNLTVSSEYRYTWLLQNFTQTDNEYTGLASPLQSGAEQYFSTNEAIKWFPIPNQMLYFAFANGVKPGGFNATAPASLSTFGPESDLEFEGGFKTQFLENRLQLDATAYHVDVTNLQLFVPIVTGNEVIEGEGKTQNTGFEIDARALPVDGLTITGGFNYNNPTFASGVFDAADAYNCAELPACLAKEKTVGGLLEDPIGGNAVPQSSKYSFSVEAEYDYLLADQYPAYVRADYTYKSSQFTDPTNLTSIPGSSDLDFFAGVSDGRYTLSAYVKNITNNLSPEFFQYESTLDYLNKVPAVDLPPGRTFAFTVAAKF